MASKLSHYQPFIVPSYKLNEFIFRIKLNQRVNAASIIYKGKFKKKSDSFYQEPIPDNIIINIINKHCSPPILVIRKWKKWMLTIPRFSKYNYKCEYYKT